MRLQPDGYSCGVDAVVNACLALGHDHTGQRDQIELWARTSSRKGTDEKGIIAALSRLGYSASQMTTVDDGEVLWSYVCSSLSRGEAVVLCVDDDEHWIAVIGLLGARVIAFDSQRTKENLAENGVLVLDKARLLERLGDSRYAIAVGDHDEKSELDSRGRGAIMDSVLQMMNDGRSMQPTTESSLTMPEELSQFVLGGRIMTNTEENR
jgi:hypothetical protein